MFHPISLFIGMRYAGLRRRGGFVSFITLFSVIGILLGVLALVVVVSVMNGLEGDLKKRILGAVPQVVVSDSDQRLSQWQPLQQQIAQVPQVQRVSPFIEAQAMIQSPGQLEGVMLQGIYPEHESQSVLSQHMIYGELSALDKGYGLVMGYALSRKLGVSPGDKVRLVVPSASRFTPLGRVPAQRLFTIVGLFEMGSEVDQQLVYLHGEKARRLLNYAKGQITGLRLYLDDAFNAKAVSQHVGTLIGEEYQVRDWTRTHGTLFQSVKMEKNMIWLMLTLIVAVAAFNVVSALVMLVMDKQGEIAILKTLGLSASKILLLFVFQGAFYGVVGACCGAILGVVGASNLNAVINLLGLSVFSYGQGLPIQVEITQVVMILVSAIAMSLIATLYPAYRASQTQPAQALRYE